MRTVNANECSSFFIEDGYGREVKEFNNLEDAFDFVDADSYEAETLGLAGTELEVYGYVGKEIIDKFGLPETVYEKVIINL